MANPLSNYEKFSILGRRRQANSGSVLTGGKNAARGISVRQRLSSAQNPLTFGNALSNGQFPFGPGSAPPVGEGWL